MDRQDHSWFGGEELLGILRDAGLPAYSVFGSRPRGEEELAASDDGEFVVFNKISTTARLVPPIDWHQDPFDSPPWRAQLHSLRFVDALVRRWDVGKRPTALRRAADVALDWVRANPLGSPKTLRMAWADKIVGDRAPFLGFVFRAAGATELLSGEDAEHLYRSILEHGRWLAADEHYTPTNHGLSQDMGLIMLAGYVPWIAEAAAWSEHALDRFVSTLARQTSASDGLHLEQSPGYHVHVVNLIRKVQRLLPDRDHRLARMAAELEDSAAWLVTPDGRMPVLGDTSPMAAPAWAAEASRGKSGIKGFTDAGYAVVRRDGSCLIATGGFHTRAHKQADDLTFLLWESGESIIGEAGKYGYVPSDPGRIYARSADAHNVLTLDGEDFPWRTQEPYGSGITGVVEAQGWFAIGGTNPLLASLGARHRRLMLYRPSLTLLVVDLVESSSSHLVKRHFHFAPHVAAAQSGDVIRFRGNVVEGTLTTSDSHPSDLCLLRGQREPRVQGWSFPEYRQWEPATTVEITTRADVAQLAAVFSLGAGTVDVSGCELDGDERVNVRLRVSGVDMRLAASVSGESLQVEGEGQAI